MKHCWWVGLTLGCAIATSGNFTAIASAQTPPTPIEDRLNPPTLTVGIGGAPPFLIQEEEQLRGIIPDLWEYIAASQNIEYELVVQSNTQEALNALANEDLDLLVGPFSITAERLENVDFTQPFFVSRIGVVIPSEPPSLWSRIRPLFRVTALSSAAVLLFILFLVGNGIWLAERKHNPDQFPPHYLKGVGNGMWFALVTLTTVGYGDRAPSTSAGRFIAGIWMLISMLAVSSLTAGLASALTLALSGATADSINSPEDLQNKTMAVVSGTTGVAWAREYQANPQKYPALKDAIAAVAEGNVDGAIFDRPSLQYYLSQNPDRDLQLAEFTLHSENLGFALPRNSPLTRDLSQILLRLEENDIITEISDRWLQQTDGKSQSSSESQSSESSGN